MRYMNRVYSRCMSICLIKDTIYQATDRNPLCKTIETLIIIKKYNY